MAYSIEEIEETFARIIQGISDDGESLRSVLMRHSMPSSSTFYEWIDSDKTKAKRYARACEDRTEKLVDEIIEISDNSTGDNKTMEDGTEVPDHEWIARSRLRVDSRKWLASRLHPKKYGDKQYIDMEVSEIKPIITKRQE